MATIKLPYTRFVRQVSNGTSRSKYSYLAMMKDNETSLESATWSQAKASQPSLTVNQLTRTDGTLDEAGHWLKKPTYTAYLDDSYDCFTQAGDAVSSQATMCGYAGIVAYRFTLPTVNKGAINELNLDIQRDRYLRSGVRVVVKLSNDPTPSDDWSVIRGTATGSIVSPSEEGEAESGVSSWGFLGQASAGTLLDSRPSEGVLNFKDYDFPTLDDAASYTYLYVYLSPEDFTGNWLWYSEKDQRSYYIEGSAMLIPTASTFTFATAAEPPLASHFYELVKNGVVPSFGATEVLSPVLQTTVQKNGDPIDYNSIKQLAATVVGNGGHVNGTKLNFPSGTNTTYHYAIIYGYGFKGTWPDIPGLVVYDVKNSEMLYSDVAVGINPQMSQQLKDGVYGVYDVIFNGNVICPLFYQVGHTDPTPVLDGTMCYRYSSTVQPGVEMGAIRCFSFNINDVSTTNTSTISYYDTTLPLPKINSAVSHWQQNPTTQEQYCITQNIWMFPYNGNIWNSTYEPNYPYSRIPVPYVGTIRGMVPVNYDGSLPENERVSWAVLVYGDLTSVGGVACSKCAIVYMMSPSGESSAENPWTYRVDVPEIDSDPNWPTLGDTWSVAPQCDVIKNGTRLIGDMNSYLVCGCADHKVRRWVTGVWYLTQYDDMLVQGREMPQTGVIGNSEGYGGFFPATIASEDTNIPLEDGAAGLRALYGRFRAYGLSAVPNVTNQIGAAFCVSWKECQLKSSGVRIGSWQIAASALVVPFACPDWDASKIEFDWSSWEGMKTQGVKFHVWLMRDAYNLSPESIRTSSLWGSGASQGAEYVGEIDPNQNGTTAILPLSRPLSGGYATLIVTAYIPMDEVNPSQSPTFPRGASTLEVNMADATIVNGDTAFLPDITLA